MSFDVVLPERRFKLGEGPHWDAPSGTLYWVDIVAGEVWSHTPATGATRHWPMGQSTAVAIPREKGGLLVTLKHEVIFFDPETGTRTSFTAREAGMPENRANESRVDPAGRFWLGSMPNDRDDNGADLPPAPPTGGLHRVETDGRSTRIESGIGCANTLVWDEARGRMYFGDSSTGTISVYDWDAGSGEVANRRPFAGPHPRGVPDGSALDADGYLWNARWGGSCIIRYAPDGTIDRIIETPVTQPTSCVFGGPDLRTLYVTSAAVGLSNANPLEGALLRMEAPVTGQPCTRFNG